MGNITAYIILIVAVILGTASNGFAKGAQGFTLLIPSIITAVTIFGVLKYKQIPNFYGILGIALIVIGVILVNYLGKTNS